MLHASAGSLLLAIDQGTTNTKALLVDRNGRPVFRSAVPLTLSTPQPGFVEQDPCALWRSVQAVSRKAAAFVQHSAAIIEGVAISNQRETAIAWHRGTGEPLSPAVSWQCRRSAALCQDLSPHSSRIRQVTGLPLDPVLSATKWAWLLQNMPGVREVAISGDLCFGTVDSWLVYNLTSRQVHATDTTNASRTGLFDLHALAWSAEMLELFGIPEATLPQVRRSSGAFGYAAAINELGAAPIVAAIGDSHAALAGHGAFEPGTMKATYGTGSSLMTLTSSLAGDSPRLARTVAWSAGSHTQYALEGNIFMTGSAVQWLGEFLGLSDPASSVAALAETVSDTNGLYFVPGMVGLGAPHWDSSARGLVSGLGRSHTSAHLARAAVESIAFQVADVFFAMQEAAGVNLDELRADGGATRNRSLMQFQADLLGIPVLRSENEELSGIGAAYLGGLELGWWNSLEEIAGLARATERVEPTWNDAERSVRYAGWQQAVHRALPGAGVSA